MNQQQRTRNQRRRTAGGAALALLMLSAPAALAAGTPDAEQIGFGGSRGLIGTHENGPDVRLAQTFVAGATGELDQVDVWVRAVGSPDVPLSVELTALDGGGLPTTALGSAAVAQASVPACNTAACIDEGLGDYTTFSAVAVPLSAAASVTAGTEYAIVLSATGATLDIYGDMIGRTANRYEWAGLDNDFMYGDGVGLSYNGSVGWVPANVDFAFRTYVSSYSASVAAPINADGSSVFKAKGTVPVRFTLAFGGTATCSLPPATIAVTRTAGVDPGPVNESTYLFAADNGSDFRIAGCQYTYNLNSRGLGSGTYLVEIRIAGAIVGSASFELH